MDKQTITSLANAPIKAVDIETTGLTPGSEPKKLAKKWLNQGWDNTPRMRVVSACWQDQNTGEVLSEAVDLDNLKQNDRTRTVEAALTGTVVGHNFGFDLFWLRSETDVMPERVVDTLLWARTVLWYHPINMMRQANTRAYYEDVPHRDLARDILSKDKWPGMWSLDTLATVYCGKKLDKQYQDPKNYMPPELDAAALDYAADDAVATWGVLQAILGVEDGNTQQMLHAIDHHLTNNTNGVAEFDGVVEDTVLMRERGLPISHDQVHAHIDNYKDKAVESVKEVVDQAPELAEFEEMMADPDQDGTRAFKDTIAQVVADFGVDMPVTEKTGAPQVSEPKMRGAGLIDHPDIGPILSPMFEAKAYQKEVKMARQMLGFAERAAENYKTPADGTFRIHSLITPGAATGRMQSREPNVQQAPGSQEFRDLFVAPQGKNMLACDFGALDLRVAAALAIRAQMEIQEAIQNGDDKVEYCTDDTDIDTHLQVAESLDVEANNLRGVKQFAKAESCSHDALKHRLAYRYKQCMVNANQNKESQWSALRDSFVAGLDIHHATTIRMWGGNPFDADWFGGLTGDDLKDRQDELKEDKEFAAKRKKGKIANLSLQYGMGPDTFKQDAAEKYGTDWSYSEAAEIRMSWLDTYPEIPLWHAWNMLAYKNTEQIWVPNTFKPQANDRPAKFWTVYTLGGRPIIATNPPQAHNYQDQGTGADIVAQSIRYLRDDYPDVYRGLINQVHDEIVVEAPEAEAEEWGRVVQDCMIRGAHDYIYAVYGVPMEADVEIGQTWQKG